MLKKKTAKRAAPRLSKKSLYNLQIEHLICGDVYIGTEWANGRGLFQFACPGCGCLTMIRAGHPAPRGMTREIRADERIPCSISELQAKFDRAKTKAVKREVLQPFLEWQERFDREIRNKKKP